MTLYASQPVLLNLLLLAPIPLLYALPRLTTTRQSKHVSKAAKVSAVADSLPTKPFLTIYRGSMLVITCLAILAVDFRIFPRRFAKVETWGTSLMDMGVGSFVFSAGVMAARPILKRRDFGQKSNLGTRMWESIRHSLPLLVLGFIRLYSVKGLDYAEHVTEYGVHWNFFFTLGFMPPFVALFEQVYTWIPSHAAIAVFLAVAYQITLDFLGLKAYVLTAPRIDILSQNREGIFSFVGYLSIFLAGQSTGMYVLPRSLSDVTTSSRAQRMLLLKRLAMWSAVWIGLFMASTSYRYGLSLTVSRRLANLPYVLWVAAFNTTQILAFCLAETLFAPQWHRSVDVTNEKENYTLTTSRVLRAYNRNGLAVFLVANLGTGIVNMTCKTLHWGGQDAMALLMGYALAITGVAMALDWKDINLRL